MSRWKEEQTILTLAESVSLGLVLMEGGLQTVSLGH